MIFIDVTAACLLPLQSGIPRTTRGVYELLARHDPDGTLPIFWQPFRGGYTGLSTRSASLLRDPFASPHARLRTPRDSTLPLLWAAFADLRYAPLLVPLERRLTSRDTLLLTSLFPDNRLEYLLKLAGRPGRRVALFHDAIPLRDPHVAAWEKARHVKTLRVLASQHLVLAVSRASEQDLLKLWRIHGISPAPTRVLPWPAPFSNARPAFTEPAWHEKKILYVSRLKFTKNHTVLFAACEKLWSAGENFSLELIGCKDVASQTQPILREIVRLRAAGRALRWRGHITEDELHRAYREATFTVFPSLAEGFGLPVLESFWHGRGVVCGDEGAVGELSHDGGSLIVNVRDAGALAEALASLLRHREKNLALARSAYARQLRSWSDYGRELRLLLEEDPIAEPVEA